MNKIALVVGARSITGSNLAEKLISKGWLAYGLARNPNTEIQNLIPVAADLLNAYSLSAALADIAPRHGH